MSCDIRHPFILEYLCFTPEVSLDCQGKQKEFGDGEHGGRKRLMFVMGPGMVSFCVALKRSLKKLVTWLPATNVSLRALVNVRYCHPD